MFGCFCNKSLLASKSHRGSGRAPIFSPCPKRWGGSDNACESEPTAVSEPATTHVDVSQHKLPYRRFATFGLAYCRSRMKNEMPLAHCQAHVHTFLFGGNFLY